MQMVMTVAEVAQMLECTQQTIEEKARQKILPGIKFGRSYIFPVEALMECLNNMARALLNPLAHEPTPLANEPAPQAANEDFAIATSQKSVSVSRLRKSPAHEFGTTRRAKKQA